MLQFKIHLKLLIFYSHFIFHSSIHNINLATAVNAILEAGIIFALARAVDKIKHLIAKSFLSSYRLPSLGGAEQKALLTDRCLAGRWSGRSDKALEVFTPNQNTAVI